MRPALAVLVAVLLALAVPAAASAQCGCVRFASAFVKNRGHAQAVYNREAASRGVDARLRRRLRGGRGRDYPRGMNEPARWAIWVASAIGPLLAVYGLFELAGWHGGAASW